jgi:hypothetical protein
MGLYLPNAEPINKSMPGIEVVQLRPNLGREAFAEFADSLEVPAHLDSVGNYIPSREAIRLEGEIAMSRTVEDPRDDWAPDRFIHFDHSYWGNKAKDQFATLLYMQHTEGDRVAPTGIIDTAILLQVIEDDNPGFTDELIDATGVFWGANYYHQILPLQPGAEAAIQRTISAKGVETLAGVADLEAEKYPPKTYPAVAVHPFRGGVDCIVADVPRLIAFLGLSPERSDTVIQLVKERYLDLPPDTLADRPYYHIHEWKAGQVLIFPQIGTLHQSLRSPPEERLRDTLRYFIA